MTIAAVILAAGASTRMGRPKALIEWQGRPFFVHCMEVARAVGCDPVAVVWGAVPLPQRDGAIHVENPAWRRGPLSSLQTGLRSVLAADVDPSGVFVLTVDRPHVSRETLLRLIEAHERTPSVVVQPRFGDISGHPILLPHAVIEAMLNLSPEDNVRSVLGQSSIRDSRIRVPVEDPAVLDNLDTPQDLRRLGGSGGAH